MDNGDSYSNGSSSYRSRRARTYTANPRIAGFEIKPWYLYIAAGIVLVFVMYMMYNVLHTASVMHFGMVAGALLLLANVRELIGKSYARHNNTALLNCLIGAALVCAWLGEILMGLFWAPAFVLLVIAAPLAIGRASVYTTYMQTARSMFNSARRAAINRWN